MKITINPKLTLEQLVKKGNYNYNYVNSEFKLPGAINKAAEFELIQEKTLITTQELWDKYGSELATIREVLEFGHQHPDAQRKDFIVGIEKVGELFWCAVLRGDDSRRGLDVRQDLPVGQWDDVFRFLRRKSLDSGKLGSSVSWPLEELEINGIKYRKV